MSMDVERTLDQAIGAIKNGSKEKARALLLQVLRLNPRSVQAWLWMSSAVDTDEQQLECLHRALALDPTNPAAQAGLQWVQTRQRQKVSPRSVDAPVTDSVPSHAGTPAPSIIQTHAIPAPHPITAQERDPIFAIQALEPSVRQVQPAPEYIDQARRKKGYRNVMLAGAMVLSLLCGLVLLITILTGVVPQAQKRMQPTPEPVLFTALLWCPPCDQAGSSVVLWEQVGDGISRGAKVGELTHNTEISVLAEEWSQAENRLYLQVMAQGRKGWVPETFVKR